MGDEKLPVLTPKELPCPGCGEVSPVIEWTQTRTLQRYTVRCYRCMTHVSLESEATRVRANALALANDLEKKLMDP